MALGRAKGKERNDIGFHSNQEQTPHQSGSMRAQRLRSDYRGQLASKDLGGWDPTILQLFGRSEVKITF